MKLQKQKNQTDFNHFPRPGENDPYEVFVSSEGALIAITPLFEHTQVLDNNLSINAMMTLLTLTTIMTEITEMTWNVK